jgi:beta-xylosidase
MIVNECDTSKIQIYAATSDDLIHWEAANKGNPILTVADFKNCSWAGVDITGNISQTPFASDIVRYNNKWYLFLDGYCKDGKRHIGLAISETTLLGPYRLMKEPLLSPGAKGSWNDVAVFYGKVKRYKDGFIMFYDGRNVKREENVGKAFSKDLIH